MKLSDKIRENFPQLSILQNKTREDLFVGHNLPAFIKSYLLMRFTVGNTGVIDVAGLKEYLADKMSNDAGLIRSNLLAGKKVNLTCRFYVKSDLQEGITAFTISDVELGANAYILQSIVDENAEALCDGENWGNITMEYVEPEGRKKGYVNMIEYRPFRPLSVDLDYYIKARQGFSLQEWIDTIIATMGYNPSVFEGKDTDDTNRRKMEFCSRLLIAIEPRVNIIEFGPKGTGKSYLYNNNSKYFRLHNNGSTTRAELIYNRNTKQYGPLKTYDGLIIDEITTLDIKDNEVSSPLKGYMEDGKVTTGNVSFCSECGIGCQGNIPLTDQLLPYDTDYYRYLPGIFRASAIMDRFHGFIEGWKIPRLSVGSIYEGWAINMEYFSEIMHSLRKCPEYGLLFDKIVTYDPSADLRDVKAVKKLATAYSKLLFPHIKSLDGLTEVEKQEFLDNYEKYCLKPAIEKRSIIRLQCHLLDKEYKPEMPSFYITCFDDEKSLGPSITDGGERVSSTTNDTSNNSPLPEGRILIYTLFLSEDEFEIGEKQRRMKLIEESQHWIEKQAAQYGKKLTFVNGTNGLFNETIHTRAPLDYDNPDYNGIDSNNYLGLTREHYNVDDLLSLKESEGCDKAALLLMVDSAGRSYCEWNGANEEFMGTAVIYADNNLEGVIAHEILHLFSADDLYAPYQSDENVAFIKEHYPNEVMYNDQVPIDNLIVSPYTAWKVGWTNKKEDWFDNFINSERE